MTSKTAALPPLATGAAGLPIRLAAAVAAIRARLAARRRMRRDLNRLMSLDDHLLDDMGIDRADVERALRGRRC